MYIKYVKRILDFLLAIILLILTFPIMLLTAIAIKLEDPEGSILFKQDRLGLHGIPFKIYKFRSMIVNAEKKGTGVYSYENDPRVTKVGKLIRKTSIDELPQLFNIIKGEMSIIGPRPPLTYHPWQLNDYTEEQKIRFNVRPGVTGLAQINGRKDVPWEDRIKYDIEYINELSFLLDIKIFLMTIIKVLTMKDNVNVKETAKKEDIKT